MKNLALANPVTANKRQTADDFIVGEGIQYFLFDFHAILDEDYRRIFSNGRAEQGDPVQSWNDFCTEQDIVSCPFKVFCIF